MVLIVRIVPNKEDAERLRHCEHREYRNTVDRSVRSASFTGDWRLDVRFWVLGRWIGDMRALSDPGPRNVAEAYSGRSSN
jgi:hypothetical protein